ncbi:DUF4397 domain-containing protein [Rossellomorea marisflavi]|uniref:DUF4397 domain-containing protein n=1 Tax=Rossellomorea marisflavi TaxID=189381 RepID=A0A0J5V9Y2_9BACI|nr:DUF4397 domain-containing protein [Rossellomorea marisflavi]KMK93530.1 hypothetical protein VL03_11565 [Rossellomorea marisflavi]KML01535.1 hypothetical protein VL06_19425 [Rossellomorea marisflavi]KML33984.1 hypothetical protein VL12_06935 [Rossellomorea marisflavi]KZE45522.1 hypothetical protein AV649_04875 [Rossellomorea marisflavi]QHA36648.1 DUF4397 domain-containing protein [Rossellomorea marisflavi]
MSQEQYLNKAAMYDLLSCYYKYSNPNMHHHYYLKHLKYMRLALEAQRADLTTAAQPSYVRVFHGVPDAGEVDVYVNGHRVLRKLAFKDVSDYLTLPGGKYHIDVYPTGTSTETIISKKVKVDPGKAYTLAAAGTTKKLQLLPYVDEPGVPAGETKVKFIHLSPDAPAVDIAVKGRDVIFPNVSFKQATEYLGLTPMTVDLEVRPAGSKDVVLSIPDVKFEANQAYTIIAAGFAGGEPALEAVLING